MTLIVAAGNHDQFIQISDRRFSIDGKISNDESNKAIVLFCANARLSIGFTGLAKYKKFITQEWLLKSINECGPPDYTAENIVKRFTLRATKDFNELPEIKYLSREHKRLSIMFTGFLNHHEPPLGALAVVSNFQNLDQGTMDGLADPEFRVFFREEMRPNNGKISLFAHIGTLPPIPEELRQKVVELVKNRKPSQAIVSKLAEIFRILSDHPQACNTIGKQLMSVVIPRSKESGVECNYHSEKVSFESFMPDQIYAVSSKLHLNVSNVSIVPVDKDTTPPMAGPKLRGNEPCWCKSGKKFKHCHGKKGKRLPFTIEAVPDK